MIENFRPGQLERLGIGPTALRRANPDLVIAHISGFGQDGPYRDRPAFGVIGEAMGGLRHLTNHEPGQTDLPPVRVGGQHRPTPSPASTPRSAWSLPSGSASAPGLL